LRFTDIVDGTIKSFPVDGHTSVFCPHVGMVIGPIKQDVSTAFFRYDPKNSAH
jgi:hypothetical protein